jgi:hypothetical protein
MRAIEYLRHKILIEKIEPNEELFADAEILERKQIIGAYGCGKCDGSVLDDSYWGEQYYEEKYGK